MAVLLTSDRKLLKFANLLRRRWIDEFVGRMKTAENCQTNGGDDAPPNDEEGGGVVVGVGDEGFGAENDGGEKDGLEEVGGFVAEESLEDDP